MEANVIIGVLVIALIVLWFLANAKINTLEVKIYELENK